MIMIMMTQLLVTITYTLLISLSTGIELSLTDPESINSAARTITTGILDYYPVNTPGTPIGMFQAPYYWWQSGAAWGSMLDYSFYTNDHQYDELIKESLLAQVGEKWDYVPSNQSLTEGNDDQGFWGITVMAAAERNFSNPVEGVQPQWVFLAQAVFNTMSDRWDESHCGGGLRWQIFPWNSGYDYKNTVSNGCLFHLAARLARFTENNTYVEWAEKAWDWMEQMELIDGGGGGGGVGDRIVVFDGAFVGDNCSHITLLQWSYNAGLLLSGAAYLYDYTKEPIWEHRVHLLLNGTSVFFQDGIMFEAACQRVQNCNNDQRSFKAYLARFLGLTAQLVEGTREIIDLYLQTSAVYAARSCTGGTDGVTCGLNWLIHENDGVYGLGEQMSALEVIQNLRYMDMPLPYTAKNGGTSKGDINAGWTRDNKTNNTLEEFDITTGSKVGASFITAVIGVSLICGLVYLVI